MSAAAAEARAGPFVREVLGRSDYAIISELVEPNTRVLDLGCGDGELLQWLAHNKGVDARGVEITGAKVQRAIARGVSVYQGDIDQGLADYPDYAFDYIILSQTLQETRRPLPVLREMLRVGRRGIVAFPNFGHWKVRLAHLWTGRAPQTKLFPHNWYDSPNIHFLTVDDFVALVEQQGWTIERAIFLAGNKKIRLYPNLTAETSVFLIRK
ncbi:MAG: methionine biosynthesis protein MetW [Acidobacteria bacterium]|nr:methionine biosynthesis protein MetW [Acidobacteriota bacterium]MBI3281056.1 methionine biosynthesis protein MetW [Acidobacteriota bacterium]